MTAEQLYIEHFQEIASANNDTILSEVDVNRLLVRLLKCLPNDGKFYKYRKGTGQHFKHAFDSLKKNYIWLSTASSLNDDIDTTLNFIPEKEINDIKHDLSSHPIELANSLFNTAKEKNEILFGDNSWENELFGKIITCYNKETAKLDRNKAIYVLLNNGLEKNAINGFLNRVDCYVKSITNDEKLSAVANNFIMINKKLRELGRVFSVSECYNSDTMWAYYTDNNGFCVEYDLSKTISLPLEKKKCFLNFYKVLYNDKKDYFSFLVSTQLYLSCYKDKELFAKSNRMLVTQLITKQEKWKEEKEWRLLLYNVNNIFYVDLVSAIYIDQSMLETNNGKKLISLSKKNGWKIFVRRLNTIRTAHVYEQYGL